MKGPAGMEADLPELVRLFHIPEIPRLKHFADLGFTLIADFEVPPKFEAMAASGESQRPHLERGSLQRDPGSASVVVTKRPIILICVPWRETAARFLIKR